jgi:hypothetical protein
VDFPTASGVLRVLIKGSTRARVDALLEHDAQRADLTVLTETDTTDATDVAALKTTLLSRLEQRLIDTRSWPPKEPGPAGEGMSVAAISAGLPLNAVIEHFGRLDSGSLADQLAAQRCWLTLREKQELLETLDAGKRLALLDTIKKPDSPGG